MKKILVVSRARMNVAGFDDSFSRDTDWAFISILNSKGVFNTDRLFKEDHDNIITLVFDDIFPENADQGRIFSEDQANALVDFIKKNEDRNFVVHCAAGMSRSGAVGEFIRRISRTDFETFQKDNPGLSPNHYVLNLLHKSYDIKRKNHFS